MLSLLLADQNTVFAIALAVMLALALLEGVGMLLGAGVSHFLEQLLPGLHLDVDADAPDAPNALSRLLGWLHVGKLPLLMVLVIFLTAFGLLGLLIQGTVQSVTGLLLPGWIAALPTLVVATPVTRLLAGGLARILPGDETTAIDGEELIGHRAVITLGEARRGSPSEARTRDRFGQTHYVMVEPDGDDTFHQGQEVLLTARLGASYLAIANPHAHL